jgi:nanoRNase/pAp phosphatase (c-di-AMP/oligoRNAs hydrolase)
LRSEEYKGVDVSEIAHKFGGGGHKLASGFEVKGNIVETENGWEIV